MHGGENPTPSPQDIMYLLVLLYTTLLLEISAFDVVHSLTLSLSPSLSPLYLFYPFIYECYICYYIIVFITPTFITLQKYMYI